MAGHTPSLIVSAHLVHNQFIRRTGFYRHDVAFMAYIQESIIVKRVRSYKISFEHVLFFEFHAINHLNELNIIAHRQVIATHNRFLIASALSILRDT